jgi:hypothetical protein
LQGSVDNPSEENDIQEMVYSAAHSSICLGFEIGHCAGRMVRLNLSQFRSSAQSKSDPSSGSTKQMSVEELYSSNAVDEYFHWRGDPFSTFVPLSG